MDVLVRQKDEAKQLAKQEADQHKAATDHLAKQEQELDSLKVFSTTARNGIYCIWQLSHATCMPCMVGRKSSSTVRTSANSHPPCWMHMNGKLQTFRAADSLQGLPITTLKTWAEVQGTVLDLRRRQAQAAAMEAALASIKAEAQQTSAKIADLGESWQTCIMSSI